MRVIGLDLSYTSTGVATDTGTHTVTAAARRPRDGRSDPTIERCLIIADAIDTDTLGDAATPRADLVVIEDVPRHAAYSIVPLAILHGVLRQRLYRYRISVALVTPSALKRYATGKGNANKDAVRDAARDRGHLPAGITNDETDAWWLRQMGLAHLGDPRAVPVPAHNRGALDSVDWPPTTPHERLAAGIATHRHNLHGDTNP